MLIFAQKRFLGIQTLWLTINSFLYPPDYLIVVISLLLLHAFSTTPTPALPMASVCSVTQSRHLLFKQNDNISLLLQSICKPLARHGLSLKGAAGTLWVIETDWQKKRFKGCKFALWSLLRSHISQVWGKQHGVRSEQNMFANYFTLVSLSGNIRIVWWF